MHVHCLLELLVTMSVQSPACVHVHGLLELLVTMSVQMPACVHVLEQAWLAEHGPKHILVDGANVALYGQNWEHGGFTFGQIKGVLDRLAEAHPDLQPLLVRP